VIEPVNQRRGRGERDGALEHRARKACGRAKEQEQLRMREVAARDPPGLFLVDALGELDPLLGIGAARVEAAHRARELAHLQEEFEREALQAGAVDAALGDPVPERVAAEAAPGDDQLAQRIGERAGFEGVD
jgi:hypothetical protein